MYSENANAKINLFLDVVGRRNDGFHDIVSLMHTVDLHDSLLFVISEAEKTVIDLTCSDDRLPTDENNLVYRAAYMYLNRACLSVKLSIFIDKHIPIGAGLGGGSADAAATLRGLNKIFGCFEYDDLLQMAGELGSDVPFCLIGGTAICTGRGEKIDKINVHPNLCLVISKGRQSVSTPRAYGELDKKYDNFNQGCYQPKNEILNTLISDLKSNGTPSCLYNIFEEVIDIDDVRIIKEIMINSGAERTLMSGSGPSVFGVFTDYVAAAAAIDKLENEGYFASFAHSIENEELI